MNENNKFILNSLFSDYDLVFKMSSEEDNNDHLDNSQESLDGMSDETPGISLANFLFGNVNENGELEIDFLDNVRLVFNCD